MMEIPLGKKTPLKVEVAKQRLVIDDGRARFEYTYPRPSLPRQLFEDEHCSSLTESNLEESIKPMNESTHLIHERVEKLDSFIELSRSELQRLSLLGTNSTLLVRGQGSPDVSMQTFYHTPLDQGQGRLEVKKTESPPQLPNLKKYLDNFISIIQVDSDVAQRVADKAHKALHIDEAFLIARGLRKLEGNPNLTLLQYLMTD